MANFIGTYGATHIGVNYKSPGGMGYFEQKLCHTALGAASGYALKGDLDGAAAGAIGAAVGEIVAEEFKKYCDRQYLEKGGDYADLINKHSDYYRDMVENGVAIAKMSAATAAALAGQDPNVAAVTAGNAVKHNAFFIPLIVGGTIAWSAYDVAREFYTNGCEAGLKQLGIEIGTYVAGGVLMKVGASAAKVGLKIAGNPKVGDIVCKFGDKHVSFKSIEAAWDYAVKTTPSLQMALKGIDHTKAVLHKLGQKAVEVDRIAGEKVAQIANKGLSKINPGFGGGVAQKSGSGSGGGPSSAPKKPSNKGKEPANQNDPKGDKGKGKEEVKPSGSWQDFQSRMKGQGRSQKEISDAWNSYKKHYNIKTKEQIRVERNRNPSTVHGNSKHSKEEATLYQRVTRKGEHQKWGVSKDPDARYSKSELAGDRLKEIETGPRNRMLKEERHRVETEPGPLNKEPWAGAKKKE